MDGLLIHCRRDSSLNRRLIRRHTNVSARDGLENNARMAPKISMKSDMAEKVLSRGMAMIPF